MEEIKTLTFVVLTNYCKKTLKSVLNGKKLNKLSLLKIQEILKQKENHLKDWSVKSLTNKFLFIRHGETTGDVEDRYGGTYDDALSPNG